MSSEQNFLVVSRKMYIMLQWCTALVFGLLFMPVGTVMLSVVKHLSVSIFGLKCLMFLLFRCTWIQISTLFQFLKNILKPTNYRFLFFHNKDELLIYVEISHFYIFRALSLFLSLSPLMNTNSIRWVATFIKSWTVW